MNYPEKLKKGDTIGICAPSGGISEKEDITKLELAENQLIKMGYKIIETKSVRKEAKGRSASGKERAKEFMELLENEENQDEKKNLERELSEIIIKLSKIK